MLSAATAFVQTPMQFYTARFLLGVAEAGFFPGIIVYFTHWFPASERVGAMSKMIVAIPISLALGAPLPDFQLKGVDDRVYTPADFAAAKILMIVFTCNHCPTAQAYEERIKRLTAEYTPRGVAVVAINPNSAKAVAASDRANHHPPR